MKNMLYIVIQRAINSTNLSSAEQLATLPEGTSVYHTELMRAGYGYEPDWNGGYSSLTNYIIQPLGEQLSDTTGLFVWTTDDNQDSYYAVTTLSSGSENTTNFDSGNTVGPITEAVSDPSPVLIWESTGEHGRVYTQFMDYDNWNPTFDTRDGLTYAYNYFVGIPHSETCGTTSPASYAIILHIEGYGSRYEAYDGPHYFCGYELWCDDPNQSWYYGYSATHDYSQEEGVVTTGPIVNFTEQRLLRALYDTLRDPEYSNIDDNRIYIYGHSMAGSGSLAMAMRYPDVFAAAYCHEAMTNYSAATDGSVDWVSTDLVPKWGSIALNLPIENRGRYADHIAKYNGTGVWDWQNHQSQLVQRIGDDMAHISILHGMSDDVISWDSQGQPAYAYFYQGRRAFSSAITNDGHTWIGFNGFGPYSW